MTNRTAASDTTPIGPTSFAPRVQRLRRRLLAGSVLGTVVGVSLLALMVTLLAGQARHEAMIAELDRRATAARSLLYYDEQDEMLQTDGLMDDEAINGSPQVYALERIGEEFTLVFSPPVSDYSVDLVALAAQTVGGEERIELQVDSAGEAVWVVGRQFFHDTTGEIAGAVIVTGDPEFAANDQDRLVFATWVAAAALVGLLSLGSWWLIRRSLGPSTEALAQQERFVADAAHELRRPLASIRSTAEAGLAGSDVVGASLSGRALRRTVALVDDTSAMVDDLLALARLDAAHGRIAGERLRLDLVAEAVLDEVFNDVVTDSSPLGNVTLELQPVTVTGDARLLRQAVLNMVTNAQRHAGGAAIGVQVITVAEGAAVVVADSGPGFGDDVDRVFDRFRSGQSSSGTGLGLALVAAVAEAHGGAASAHNRAGGGAAVRLQVPLA